MVVYQATKSTCTKNTQQLFQICLRLWTSLCLYVWVCVCVRKFFVYYIQAVQINIKSFFLRLLLFLTVFLAFAFVCYAHCPCYCYYFCYSCCCCTWWCDFKKARDFSVRLVRFFASFLWTVFIQYHCYC